MTKLDCHDFFGIPGQPNHFLNDRHEDCGYITAYHEWGDSTCSSTYQFVCEEIGEYKCL